MSFVLAFAGFALLIILHEAGHFAAAKAVGMRVERFYLFFPPKLVSWQRGETEYGIGMIPLGGFVKITGMNPDEVHPPEDAEEPPERASRLTAVMEGDAAGGAPDEQPLSPELIERAYYNQPVWKRIVVIGAGPAVNIAIAFALLFALALNESEPTQLAVGEIEKDSPASTALKEDDRIVSIDGVVPKDPELSDRSTALSRQLNTHACPGDPNECLPSPATVVVVRDGVRQTFQLVPVYDADAPSLDEGGEPGRYRLGFAFTGADAVPLDRSVPGGAGAALDDMWFVTSTTVSTLARLFESEQRKQVSGVVGTYDATHKAIELDLTTALLVLAIISLSLGVINLFPFLPLDGGHIFWSLVEKVRGRPVAFSVMEKASFVGFALVLMLFLIGLNNDIGRLTSGEGLNTE